MLQQSERLWDIFTCPPRIVHRRPKNIKDTLMNSKTIKAENVGCEPCRKPRCKVCQLMRSTNLVRSFKNDFMHRINHRLTCDRCNVVHLLECGACRMHYVHQTETLLSFKFNNHRSHAKSLPYFHFLDTLIYPITPSMIRV